MGISRTNFVQTFFHIDAKNRGFLALNRTNYKAVFASKHNGFHAISPKNLFDSKNCGAGFESLSPQ